ncbi:MAG: hypothetical protein IJV62_00355 [Eggerthellaceae bacterium]|nr:hypothetical protein [Eggerthellaceae bacterium]
MSIEVKPNYTCTLLDYLGKSLYVSDGAQEKKIGVIHRAVLKYDGSECLGFFVRRPDVALMFHRSDVFVSFTHLEAYDKAFSTSERHIHDAPDKGRTQYIIAHGRAVYAPNGEQMGFVKDIAMNANGKTQALYVAPDEAHRYLLGMLVVPFEICSLQENVSRRSFVVTTHEVWKLKPQGGWAEDAATFVAQVQKKADEIYETAIRTGKDGMKKTSQWAKSAANAMQVEIPDIQQAQSAATDRAVAAVEKAAFATGKQLSKTKGMFSGFVDAYKQASQPDAQALRDKDSQGNIQKD